MGMTDKQKRKYHNRIKKFNLVEAPVARLQGEMWRPKRGYEDKYIVSSKGRIYDIKKGDLATTYLSKGGYDYMYIEGNVTKYIYRIVAEHFIRNTLKQPVVNHKDENKRNNDISNLEWCTYKHNANWGTAKERGTFLRTKYFDVVMIDPDTNEELMSFDNVAEAAGFLEGDGQTEDQGIAHSRICSVLRGDEPTAYGYKWICGIDLR